MNIGVTRRRLLGFFGVGAVSALLLEALVKAVLPKPTALLPFEFEVVTVNQEGKVVKRVESKAPAKFRIIIFTPPLLAQ